MRTMTYLLALLAVLVTTSAWAQDAATPEVSKAEAIDRLIVVLEDPALRDQLLTDLRAMAAGDAAAPVTPAAETPAAEPEETQAPGLVDLIFRWSTALVDELPTRTFGIPIDQKAMQASAQAGSRLQQGIDSGQLPRFALWAVPVLALALAAALLLRRLLRGLTAPQRPTHKRRLALGLGLSLVGHVAIFFVAAFLPVPLGPSELSYTMFLTIEVGMMAALFVTHFALSLLSTLGSVRSVRVIRYGQHRFAWWWLVASKAAIFASLCADPTVRRVIGWSTADVVSFALNIVAALTVWVFIARYRVAIGKLIFGGAARQAHSDNPLRNATRRLARGWHLLAYALLALSIASLATGQRNNDVMTLMLWSFGVVLIGLVAISILHRLLAQRPPAYRRTRLTVQHAVLTNIAQALRVGADTLVLVAAVLVIVRLWGFDMLSWLLSEGRPLTGPLLAAAACVAVAWLVWVALDAWIASALSPQHGLGWTPQRSVRAQTLLPLVRNGAMILLIVLTGIAVLANIGVDVTPLIAGAGVFGLALSFGSQQLVQDLITGIFILAEDTIAIGDTINTGDRSGVVESISLRTIRLRDADGSLHTIPFSTVKALKNSSRNFGVLRPRFTVPATVDPTIVLEAMRSTAEALRADPRYREVITSNMFDLGIDEVNTGAVVVGGSLRTNPARRLEIAREFNGGFLQRLGEAGVTL